MFRIIKYLSFSCIIACFGYIGYKTYWYFRDTNRPIIQIRGLDADCYYSHDISSDICSNKTARLSVSVDNKPLITEHILSGKKLSCACIIPIQDLPNGSHTLSVNLRDTTFHKNTNQMNIPFYVDTLPLHATFVKPDSIYKVFQGKTLHMQFQTNKPIKHATVYALAQKYICVPESKHSLVYEAFIPIPCEEMPNEYLLSIEAVDYPGNKATLETKFEIVPFQFKRSALNIKKESGTVEDQNIGKSRALFEEKIAQLTKASRPEKLWSGPFCTPIDIQKVTTDFGTIRTTQEKGRYMHKAIDVINTPKSVVWSTQDGIVALKERFADSGNTVVVDHGCGILSLFFHLDDFADIQVGQKITKGNPVGRLGKTGYASGYHLHWEMRVNNIAIDPMQWTYATF